MIRPLKLSIFGVLGFLGFILGETLKKEFISFFLCGILSINSVTCYTGVKASAASSQGRTDINAIATVDADGLESEVLEVENTPYPEIAIPPMIRPPQVDLNLQEALPQDFQITQQMPYSSGRRDIVMVSRSTGAEQVYTVNLPGASNFQLYQVEYRNVSAIDFSQLSGSERIIVDTSEIQTVLNRFKIGFNNNRLSQVVLADGRMAEFSGGQAIIRSPEGEQIETIQLSRVDGEETIGMRSRKELSDRGNTKDELLLAQSFCQTNVSSSLNTVASQMTRYGNKLASSRSDLTQPLGWALAFGSGTLQTNINSRNPQLQEVTCRPPVQCEERRVNGASEVRTDLFQVARGGASQEVTLEYEFFDIPDRLELSYDGKQIFAIGPASGPGRETFSLPGTADFVGVKLIGNSNPQTKWWYTISCPQFTPIPEPPIVAQVNHEPDNYPNNYNPCNSKLRSSESHRRLLSQEYSDTVKKSFETNRVTPQGLLEGETIYYDEFVTTLLMPLMPNSVTPEIIFKDMRRGLDTVGEGQPLEDFKASGEFTLWHRANGQEVSNNLPLSDLPTVGDIFHVDIWGPDNGDVMITDMYESLNNRYFRYTTLNNPRLAGEHPNRGAREYGYEKNSDGTVTFYVRGVDQWNNSWYENRIGLKEQKEFWLNFLRGIGERVKKQGGVVVSDAGYGEYITESLPSCFRDGGWNTD